VRWSGKEKVFLHANTQRIIRRIQSPIHLLTGKHVMLLSDRSILSFACRPLRAIAQLSPKKYDVEWEIVDEK
jgi:hypothetical protein